MERSGSETIRPISIHFQRSLYELKLLLGNLYPICQEMDKSARDKFQEFEESTRQRILSFEPNVKKYPTNAISHEKISELSQQIIRVISDFDYGWINYNFVDNRAFLLLRSSFILLISYLQILMSDLIRCYYDHFRDALGDKTNITLGELKRYKDINEVFEHIIDKKMESVMFESLLNQLSYFDKELRVNLHEDLVNWNSINEMVLRRNVIVHNNGIVNKRYLKAIDHIQNDLPLEGSHLSIDYEYFECSYLEIFVGGIILSQNCWRKWFPGELTDSDSRLSNTLDKIFLLGDFTCAERLCLFTNRIDVSVRWSPFLGQDTGDIKSGSRYSWGIWNN